MTEDAVRKGCDCCQRLCNQTLVSSANTSAREDFFCYFAEEQEVLFILLNNLTRIIQNLVAENAPDAKTLPIFPAHCSSPMSSEQFCKTCRTKMIFSVALDMYCL